MLHPVFIHIPADDCMAKQTVRTETREQNITVSA